MAEDKKVVEVKPFADVYTVLMVVAILALGVTIFFGGRKLMSPPDPQGGMYTGGYGITAGQLFEPYAGESTTSTGK